MSIINPDILVARPDPPDFRDRPYQPTLRALRARWNHRPWTDGGDDLVKHQGSANACTGFALAAMAECLRRRAYRMTEGDGEEPQELSPWMLYYLARRYDEFAGERDEGSSARAAMKAWHKHGATPLTCWPETFANREPEDRAWVEHGFRTPLGAYFRVDHTCIPDMHAALNETGAIYVTAMVHEGWQAPTEGDPDIPYEGGEAIQGGHAFLIVGYDDQGFWIQNSWGREWGRQGFARLSYRDWRVNAMDAWVAQIGVTISPNVEEMGNGLRLAADGKAGVRLSTDHSVRNQQINPYVVNLGNNGKLSDRGTFRTRPEDLNALVGFYLQQALTTWKIPNSGPIDIALYAHGGLTPEDAAADTASRWIPALFERKVFPVFFMWETGLVETIKDIASDLGRRQEQAGGWWDRILDWKDDRLDTLLSGPGKPIWDEMKENARLASEGSGGLSLLGRELAALPEKTRQRFRFHLIGHSAGAIFHAHLLPAMIKAGLNVDGLYLMAPACTVDLFAKWISPHFGSARHQVRCYTQFHLEEFFEERDTCTPLYNRSLLFMVSNAFEGRRGTPIIGMERFARPLPGMPPRFISPQSWFSQAKPEGTAVWDWIASPQRGPGVPARSRTESLTHGGFDNDAATQTAILTRISERAALPLI